MAIHGNATKGHSELLGWWCTEKTGAQRTKDIVADLSADDVEQILAHIQTAKVHAESVFRTILQLRPDVKFPS